jgi:uncharacterized protein (DUF1501 family)
VRWSLGGAGLFGLSRSKLAAAMAAASAPGDYRALVCVFLYGGNDAFNLIVPSSAAGYAKYLASRSTLAVPQANLVPVTPLVSDGESYGMHPDLAPVAALFQSGRLAITANVGTLIVPTTKAQYEAGSVAVPPQLFSHSDQAYQWMTADALALGGLGWCGKIADLMAGVNASALPLNVTLDGSNTLQNGSASAPYNLNTSGPESLDGFWGQQGAKRWAAFQSILNKPHANVLERSFAGVQQESIALAEFISAALDGLAPLAKQFDQDSWLGRQLEMVAKMIAVRDTLGMSRQIFFVTQGGYDTHSEQNESQPGLFAELSASLASFQAAMDELDVAECVTAFTASDFGRTLSSNGQGTDHGWGGHQLVLGGAVAGQQIYGTMPDLELDGPDDIGGGRIVPTLAVEQYAATLAKWFGVDPGQLGTLFPNLASFAQPDLGFML